MRGSWREAVDERRDAPEAIRRAPDRDPVDCGALAAARHRDLAARRYFSNEVKAQDSDPRQLVGATSGGL
jgi:hypothetical protein